MGGENRCGPKNKRKPTKEAIFSTSEDVGMSKYDKYAKKHKSGKILLIGTVDNKSLCIRETKKSKVIICLSSFTSVYLVIYLS